MDSIEKLKTILKKIDKNNYNAYKQIRGFYKSNDFILNIDHVQGDPFAAPSRFRVTVPSEKAKFPAEAYKTKSRKIACEDYVTRCFHKAASKTKPNKDSGKSGLIQIDRPCQKILAGTSVEIHKDYIETRFVVGLPAFGRRIAGFKAIEIIFDDLEKYGLSILTPEINGDLVYFRKQDFLGAINRLRTLKISDGNLK